MALARTEHRMDKLCIKDMIDFFINKLPSLVEVSQAQAETRESAAKGLARLCGDLSCAKDVVQKLHDMGSSLTLADFGDAFMHGTRQAIDTNRSVLEAIRRCLLEIQKNFPATPDKPSPFTADEKLVLQLYEYLDINFVTPSAESSQESDRLQPIAGSAMQILSAMNLSLACKYLETQVMKHSNKFNSLSIVGYFKVTTKELPEFLRLLTSSTAVSSNRSCKALCKGLHQCILEWSRANPDDFLELWLRSERPDLKAIRDVSLQLFCIIAGHVNKDKRRCAMWPCMGAVLRLCSSRIKASLEVFGSMKKGLFSGLSDDDCSKFCRRYEKFIGDLSLSSFSTPEQKSHFLVSLQVLRDALEAITLLSTHPRNPHNTIFDQELEQLWRITGSTEISGVKRPNIHICCDFLLDPTKTWLAEFSSKSEIAFSIGVLGFEKDIKMRIAKLTYDVMLSASRLKNAPKTPLQARNPFNIRSIWEMLVSQKLKNFYFTLFVVRVIREIIQECASSAPQTQDLLRSVVILPGSPIITKATKIMDCSIQELTMYLIDVVRQFIVANHELAAVSAPADSRPKPYGDKNLKSVVQYWVKQALRIISEAPHLGFIPGTSADVEPIGWLPQKAKQLFSELPRGPDDTHFRGNAACYKRILGRLETGPAKWVANKPYCAVFVVLMCFESFDLMMLSDTDREAKNLSHEAIASIFSGRLMPLYYPEAPIEGVLTVFGVICAAASEQILSLIMNRQPLIYAQKGLYLLKHCCHQLLQFLSQSTFEFQLDSPNLALLKPRLSVGETDESSLGEWLGHRVEFMIFIAACEVDSFLLAELYSFVGAFCHVLHAFQNTDHPHFPLFQHLGSVDFAGTVVDVQPSGKGLTYLIHSALRDATFQISRNHFSLTLWSHLFFTWSAYVEELMATDKQQRTIDDDRLESYASFLLLLSPTLWAPGISKEAKMTQVFNVFLEFFHKTLVEYIDDFGNPKVERRVDDKFIEGSRLYFKKFLSKSFPSIFCEELFSCMVFYYKETLTKDLQKLCRKYNGVQEEASELQAKYCLPLYCDVLLAVLSSLSEPLSQKCLKDLKEITLVILCSWANHNSSKVHPDDFIQRLQHICQVVSAMTKVRSLLPFSNGYGFWSLWLQQTYDWAVRLSNEQSSSSRVEIFNAINLLIQVLPENKLEEKDARASEKKYLKFIINELEKQTTLGKTSLVNRSGAFINDDIQGPLMNGLAAVIKKSKFSVGLDPCLKFVRDLRAPIQHRFDCGESDQFAISFTKCIFSLKVLQKSLQLTRKDSGISYSEAAALHVKFAPIINLILEPPHFFIVHGASKVADVSESEALSTFLTKVALSRDQIADLLISLVSADVRATITAQTIGRSNTIATKVSMCTIRLLQEPFLSNFLSNYASRLSAMPHYEVLEGSLIEPSVVGHAIDGLLTSIESMLSRLHPGILLVCRVWYNAVKKKFLGSELAAVGGIFFLRFICPVITILASSDKTDLPSKSEYVKHKSLIQLAAKILLGICNQISNFKESSMKLYESFLTSFSSRINAIYLRLAGDSVLSSTADDSDFIARSTSSRFSASIPPADLHLEVATFNVLHRFLHSKLEQIEAATEGFKAASSIENSAPVLPASTEVPDFPRQRSKSISGHESGFTDAVKKLGEPTIIKNAQVESSQKMQLVKIQEIENWLREPEKDIPGFDFSRLLKSDSSRTKDGGNHRLYYIFRNRTEVSDEDSRLEEKIERCTLRALLPLMKSGVKIDLILDFTKSNHVHWFSSAEIDFYKNMMPPEFAESFVNVFIVSPNENTVLFCELFKSRAMFSSQTKFEVLESPLSIFDHIPQADCLLPQESFGIENDVLGDDESRTYTFNNIVCLSPNFASTVSIKIGTQFIQISRRKTLKLPDKKQPKSSQESAGQSHHASGVQGAPLPEYTLNDAIPRSKGRYVFHKSGSNELRLETKSTLNKNIKLKCEGDQQRLLTEAEFCTQQVHQDSDLLAQDVLHSGLSMEEYISKILVVSLMGLCDKEDIIRTESQCLLSCIFQRLGSDSALKHTMFCCPPSNMNRLILEISSRLAKSDPRLALPFLDYSLSVLEAFSGCPQPPVNLQYLLLETWIPWLQRVMHDLADAHRIQHAKYNLDALNDEAVNDRWGSYKILEVEISNFIKGIQSFGEKVVSFVVKLPNGEDLFYYIILNRIWPLLNSDEKISRHLFGFALGVQIDELQQSRYHELLVYTGFQWPQSAGRELMSRIKTATERQFNPKPLDSHHRPSIINLHTDGPQALSAEMQELLQWLKDMKRMIEILKLISFENLYILRANFGQQLHLYCLFLSIIPFNTESARVVHIIQQLMHTSILNSAALLDIAAKSTSNKVTAESIFLGESSPSLDDAGRPLVGVIIGILRDACNFSDFSLCDHIVDAKQAASGVTALAAPPLMPSINRDDLIERPSLVSLKEPQTETDRTRVRFKHSLVARLGAIARKLLEVVDIIQRSSSTELTQFTEIWKIQWHFEATMFIENRLEMQHVNTLYSIAACNSIYYVVVGDVLRPAPSSPRDHLFIEMLQSLSDIVHEFQALDVRAPSAFSVCSFDFGQIYEARRPTDFVRDVQNDFMMSWEGHGQVSEMKNDPYPSARLLVAHSIITGISSMMRAFRDCESQDILALASFAMALLPVGYQSSIPFAREGITSTIGFQLLGAVLSIHVKYSPGESVGRLEDRIMHWISETSTQFTESQAAAASPARPASSKVAAADVLWPMRAAFDRLNASAKLPSQQTSSWSPCEMFAIVFMFKAIPVLAIPDSSNSLTAPAMRSVRAFVLQYYDMCAAEGSSRKSIGSGPPTAGEGADALYLCLLSLLLQPGDAELLQRLGMSRLERHESDEAGAGDSEAPDAAPLHPPFDDVVVMLLSKLEPSGILDRWPAFMCALFLRFLDALIIGSQAIPLIRSDADHPLYKIRNPDSVRYDGAAAMLLPAIDSAVSAGAAGAGAGFNYEYESGLCIILRLLARFVDVAHKSASLSVPFTASSFVTFIDSGSAPSAVDDVAAGVAGAGLASAMQGYGSWLLYRASQLYSHCSVPRVKEAAWSLFMSAINLVKVVPEKEQERIRHALTDEIRELTQNYLTPLKLYDVSLRSFKCELFRDNELESALHPSVARTVIQDLRESSSRCLQFLDSQGVRARPGPAPLA